MLVNKSTENSKFSNKSMSFRSSSVMNLKPKMEDLVRLKRVYF